MLHAGPANAGQQGPGPGSVAQLTASEVGSAATRRTRVAARPPAGACMCANPGDLCGTPKAPQRGVSRRPARLRSRTCLLGRRLGIAARLETRRGLQQHPAPRGWLFAGEGRAQASVWERLQACVALTARPRSTGAAPAWLALWSWARDAARTGVFERVGCCERFVSKAMISRARRVRTVSAGRFQGAARAASLRDRPLLCAAPRLGASVPAPVNTLPHETGQHPRF